MQPKDWITLIVPIVANGFVVFIFQKLFEKRLKKITKRQDIRDDVLYTFWKKLQSLNDLFIQMNIQSRTDPSIAANSISAFGPKVIEIVQYYDTNKYDLEIVERKFNDLQEAWNEFNNTWCSYANNPLTVEMQINLGNKLQFVKNANLELINAVRKKY